MDGLIEKVRTLPEPTTFNPNAEKAFVRKSDGFKPFTEETDIGIPFVNTLNGLIAKVLVLPDPETVNPRDANELV
jgi:hypothetical protein